MQKMFVVVNPVSAGKATAKEWPLYEKKLRENGFDFEVKYTEYQEHATEITRKALKEGYDYIVSVGGDGTMNEIVNGFFENNIQINPNARLAVFSRGTGCDFIKSLGIKKGFDDFLEVLKRNTSKTVDVGLTKYVDYKKGQVQRYFVNVSDIGIGGDTTYRVNRSSKALKGFLSFAINALLAILFYKNKQYSINIDDKINMNERLNSVIVANGKYFGGGMQVAPEAKLDDGEFDVVIFGNINTIELLLSFPSIYKGRHLTNPKLKIYKGKHITVKSEPAALLDIDGEQPGTTDVEFTIIPKAINVMV